MGHFCVNLFFSDSICRSSAIGGRGSASGLSVVSKTIGENEVFEIGVPVAQQLSEGFGLDVLGQLSGLVFFVDTVTATAGSDFTGLEGDPVAFAHNRRFIGC